MYSDKWKFDCKGFTGFLEIANKEGFLAGVEWAKNNIN
jgi:hypothetical protein